MTLTTWLLKGSQGGCVERDRRLGSPESPCSNHHHCICLPSSACVSRPGVRPCPCPSVIDTEEEYLTLMADI